MPPMERTFLPAALLMSRSFYDKYTVCAMDGAVARLTKNEQLNATNDKNPHKWTLRQAVQAMTTPPFAHGQLEPLS